MQCSRFGRWLDWKVKTNTTWLPGFSYRCKRRVGPSHVCWNEIFRLGGQHCVHTHVYSVTRTTTTNACSRTHTHTLDLLLYCVCFLCGLSNLLGGSELFCSGLRSHYSVRRNAARIAERCSTGWAWIQPKYFWKVIPPLLSPLPRQP